MSNLSHQFDGAIEAYEDSQRRRFARKKGVSGYIGNGYLYSSYPYMTGAAIAGDIMQTHSDQYVNPVQDLDQHTGQTAGDSTGNGDGGTSAGYVGGMG
jgi:hypothetical protein